MKKKISFREEEISYTIAKNKLSKGLKITINSDSEVRVSIPLWMPVTLADNFVKEKISWIVDNMAKIKEKMGDSRLRLGDGDYLKHKEEARKLIKEKVSYYNQFYGFKIGSIAIRNQKTRWGSCSSKNNLNFNYKVVFLPEALADYVVVHEICHLKEMNHSERFWKLVSKVLPDYALRRRELKKYRI
ncbi:MAG: SprT family zinc-dependent metalloprotease [Candidatus Pacebacteria bacterium]|nr:SprT family zinc-dependent metalloprotease [Candidatus Paceibacterota bacterium]